MSSDRPRRLLEGALSADKTPTTPPAKTTVIPIAKHKPAVLTPKKASKA
jgi:hypothetical protein